MEQTNLYALKTVSNFNTNASEILIEKYCGILLKMGILVMPRYNIMYLWNDFLLLYML